MKFVTEKQPIPSLIAVGAVTILTRAASTEYRGPLAIHAGMARPDFATMKSLILDRFDVWNRWYAAGLTSPDGSLDCIPFGAVVAVCDLTDVVPIVDKWPSTQEALPLCVTWGRGLYLWPQQREALAGSDTGARREPLVSTPLTDQLPFGDFTVGRFAWLLENVRPVDPVPMKGAQGLRDLPDDVLPQVIAQVTR